MLDQLSELAREKSSERRRDLLHAVTDLFMTTSSPTREQGDLFGDIVRRVLEDVTVEARAEMSRKVADHESLPRDVAMRLATDDIMVAEPMLRQSPVLTEADLVAIAENQSQDHLLAISNRESLSEDVTSVLVRRGNDAVLRTVSANEGARFTRESFKSLIAKAADDPQICNALQRRSDLPNAEQKRLADVMKEVITAGLAGSGASESAVAAITNRAMEQIEIEMKTARRQRLEGRLLLQDIRDGKITLSDAMIMLAAAERQYDIAHILGELEGIKPVQVFRVLAAPDVAGLGAICKAHDVSIEAFQALCEMRRKRLKLTTADAKAEAASYDILQPENAQRAMRFLKVRQSAAKTA